MAEGMMPIMATIIEILPWVIAVVFAVHSVFKRDSEPFILFGMSYFVVVFLYFVYKSIFDAAYVTSFFNILPLHLAFLLFICLNFNLRKVLTYSTSSDVIFDKSMFLTSIFLLLVSGGSFFIGSAFFNYDKPQYFVTALQFLFALAIFFARNKYPLWMIRVVAIAVISVMASCYLYISMREVGEIDFKLIAESVTNFSPPLLVSIMFFLAILSAYKLVSEKTWGKLLTIYSTVFSLGFLAHHPELAEITKPVMREVLQIASTSGGAGVSLFSLGVVIKVRSGIA